MLKNCLILISGVIIFASCSKFQSLQKSNDVKLKYNAATKYYEEKDYYRASLLLEEIIPLLKGSEEAELAQFKYAYTQYYLGQLALSAFHFNKFYETFARSKHAEEARYMNAYSLYVDSPDFYLDQTNTFKAIDALQSFINAYPQSEYKEEATKLLKDSRTKLEKKAYETAKLFNKIQGNHKAAVITFGNFQKSFPDSDYSEEIAYKKLEAAYYLARESVEFKKKDRYNSAIEYYENFIDKYPNSKFTRQAEDIYTSSLRALGGKKPDDDKKKDKADVKKDHSTENQ